MYRKISLYVIFSILLISITGCKKTANERLLEHWENACSIITRNDDCKMAAQELKQYTKDNIEEIKSLAKESKSTTPDKKTDRETAQFLENSTLKLKNSKCYKEDKDTFNAFVEFFNIYNHEK